MDLQQLFYGAVSSSDTPTEASRDAQERIHAIKIHKIRPNPAQPRTEFEEQSLVTLADSIKQYGILQPLTVRPLPNPDTDGAIYELVAGERRLRAAKLLGLEEVPCILVRVDGKRSAELAIIENIQRKDLNMFEEATTIASLIDLYALTQDEIARRLSTSQSYVANKLRILRLSAFEREKILRHNLTERHARALLRIEDAEGRAQALRDIIARGYNVAATEEYVERYLSAKNDEKAQKSKKNRQMKLIMKDIRLFHNTITHAIDTVRNAGVNIISSKSESEDAVEWTIRIQKNPAASAPSTEQNGNAGGLLQIDLQPTPQIGFLPDAAPTCDDSLPDTPISSKASAFLEAEDARAQHFTLA